MSKRSPSSRARYVARAIDAAPTRYIVATREPVQPYGYVLESAPASPRTVGQAVTPRCTSSEPVSLGRRNSEPRGFPTSSAMHEERTPIGHAKLSQHRRKLKNLSKPFLRSGNVKVC